MNTAIQNNSDIHIRWLGQKDYSTSWQAMQDFTNNRTDETIDEIWLLEHLPVITLGQNGKKEHILNPGDIPIIQTDRGGQVTYHGPGQLMVYTLINLRRKKFNVRELVSLLEQSVIDLLASVNVIAYARVDAPGVYTKDNQTEKKICSIGLRIRRGCSYHGIAFNINMDLTPFTLINPCGFAKLQMTQLAALAGHQEVFEIGRKLTNYLVKNLRYTSPNYFFEHQPE